MMNALVCVCVWANKGTSLNPCVVVRACVCLFVCMCDKVNTKFAYVGFTTDYRERVCLGYQFTSRSPKLKDYLAPTRLLSVQTEGIYSMMCVFVAPDSCQFKFSTFPAKNKRFQLEPLDCGTKLNYGITEYRIHFKFMQIFRQVNFHLMLEISPSALV